MQFFPISHLQILKPEFKILERCIWMSYMQKSRFQNYIQNITRYEKDQLCKLSFVPHSLKESRDWRFLLQKLSEMTFWVIKKLLCL